MILHITSRADWEGAQALGDYRIDSLTTEGFIHCSTPEQVLSSADLFYGGQPGLVLLVIDPARLSAKLVYEDSHGTGNLFPHIYGPLNLNAVVRVIPFPPLPDGSFVLPTL